MRRPQERLPQRRLVYELRRALDLERHADVLRLVHEHPLALRSAHVTRNLGTARMRAVFQVAATPGALVGPSHITEE